MFYPLIWVVFYWYNCLSFCLSL